MGIAREVAAGPGYGLETVLSRNRKKKGKPIEGQATVEESWRQISVPAMLPVSSQIESELPSTNGWPSASRRAADEAHQQPKLTSQTFRDS